MTHLMMQPSRARPYPRIPGPLFTVLATAFDSSQRVFDLFSEFFHHESYARSFTSKLLAIAKREDGDPWEVRRLATLMLHHQVLLLPPEDIEEFDFLFAELSLKASNTPLSDLKEAVFKEGFSTTELRGFIQEFRRKLERHRAVHQQINGARTSERGLLDFIALSRQECKLSLARYLFTPEEVVEEILKQVRVSQGKKDMTGSRYPYVKEEAVTTLTYLPAYEAAILRKLCKTAAISLILAAVYLTLVVLHREPNPGAGVWTIDGLVTLFSNPRVVLIGWIHYLAFDLFVGSWISSDAALAGISRWWVVPCLFFVLIMGPVGLLMYFVLRMGLRREWRVFSSDPA